MNLLPNGLFKVIRKDDNTSANNAQDQEFIPINECGKWGWEKAKTFQGAESGLLICLKCLFENHKKWIRSNRKIQDQEIMPYKVKLEACLTRNKHLRDKVTQIKEEVKPVLLEKIESIKEEVREIRKDPAAYLGSDTGKAGYFIGLVILLFLTVYLFVFYSSASYSAFFKTFTLNEIGVANSIFDPQAVANALKEGILELVLILTIPFVFLGLGYLIHKFQEEKGWKKIPKIAGFILVTLIFDIILAYGITKEIYDIREANSFQDTEPYSLELAFVNVQFWTIIFAGFIVYLIWGFVFDFVMEGYAQRDRITTYIKTKKEEIAEHEKQLNKKEEEIDKLNHRIARNDTEANKLKAIIDHTTILPSGEMERVIAEFFNGWLEWLTSDRKPEEFKERSHQLVREFITINIYQMPEVNEN